MLSKEDKKLIILSLGYLILGNVILAIIFWPYLGYKLLNPKELWEKLTS